MLSKRHVLPPFFFFFGPLIHQTNGSNDPSLKIFQLTKTIETFPSLWKLRAKALIELRKRVGDSERPREEITVPQPTATRHLVQNVELGNAFILSQGRHFPHQIAE